MVPRTDQHLTVEYILKHYLIAPNSKAMLRIWSYLRERYPNAPGSSGNHQAYPGGYFDHIQDCMNFALIQYYIMKKNSIELNFDLQDVLTVLFLHDLEKPLKYSDEYKPEISDTDIKLWYINHFGIRLNDSHKNALKYIHGEGDDYSKTKRIMSELAALCHICDVMSARIFHRMPINT